MRHPARAAVIYTIHTCWYCIGFVYGYEMYGVPDACLPYDEYSIFLAFGGLPTVALRQSAHLCCQVCYHIVRFAINAMFPTSCEYRKFSVGQAASLGMSKAPEPAIQTVVYMSVVHTPTTKYDAFECSRSPRWFKWLTSNSTCSSPGFEPQD